MELKPATRLRRLAAALDDVELQTAEDPDGAFILAGALEQEAAELGSEHMQLRAQLVQADVQGRRGQAVASARTLRSINRWAVDHKDMYLLARSHRLLGVFFSDVGDEAAFLEHSLRGVELLEHDCRDALRVDHLLVLGTAQIDAGAFESGREHFALAEVLATRSGNIVQRIRAINNLAYLEQAAGQHDAAVQTAERLIGFASAHGVDLCSSHLDTIARVYLESARFAEAEQILSGRVDDAANFSLYGTDSDALGVAELTLTLSEVQRRRGDTGSASATLRRCRQICEAGSLGGVLLRVRAEQAELFATQGRYREAFEELKAFNREWQEMNGAARAARASTLQAVFDANQARRASHYFQEMSLRDPLTGLYNRRFVENRLLMILGPGGGDQRRAVSVAFLDLDHFKRINDTFSHDVGDRVLQQIASHLAEAAGADGFAARMGGEEFLLVLPSLDHASALNRCDHLQSAIRDYPWHTITPELAVRASIGLVTAFAEEITQAELLAEADRNVYAAKIGGRDRITSSDLRGA
jgi:two-component system cell cycle response regulator